MKINNLLEHHLKICLYEIYEHKFIKVAYSKIKISKLQILLKIKRNLIRLLKIIIILIKNLVFFQRNQEVNQNKEFLTIN